MNVLGLFLASALRRNLIERGRACPLTGGLTVDADGMRATVRFESDGCTVTRKQEPARVTVSASLPVFVEVIARPGLATMLRVKVRGNFFFALRAMRFLAP